MTHRNFMRDAFHTMMHHCDHQTDGKYNQRHPMAQTGQIPDALADGLISLGMDLLRNALANNGVRTNTQEIDNEANVLASATAAYQRGHITKAQYFAVIDALDETTTAETTAWTVPNTAKIVRR